jgi:hypothetical protein
VNTTINGWAFGFQPADGAMAVLWLCYGCAMAVLWLCCLRAHCPLAAAPLHWWRTFSRAGFVAFVAQGGGEVTQRRKGAGAAVNLVMPRYSNDEPCGYHGNLHASAHHGAVHTWAMSRAGHHGNLHASAHHGAVHTWAMSRAGTMANLHASAHHGAAHT